MSSSTPYFVLCVDDEPSGLGLREVILQRKGYTVFTAENASDALAIFNSRDVDIVVTDHLLGRTTGTVMAKEMKRLKPRVPIIVLSGTTDTLEDIEIADAFLSKAEGPEILLSKVKELASRSRMTRVSSVADLTMEEELVATPSETLQLLAAIVESSNDAIFSKALDGKILTWNRAAETMYGYRADEIIGKSVSILQPADRRSEVHEMVERLKNGQKVEHLETTRVAKTAIYSPCRLPYRPFGMPKAGSSAPPPSRTILPAQSLPSNRYETLKNWR